MIKTCSDISMYGVSKNLYGGTSYRKNEKELGTLTVSNVTVVDSPNTDERVACEIVKIEFETENGTVCAVVNGDELKTAINCVLLLNDEHHSAGGRIVNYYPKGDHYL